MVGYQQMKMRIEQKAKEFATKIHTGQYRKDGKTPYIKHCEAIVSLLKEIEIKNEDILAAAWLHDTVEDCKVTIKQIEQEFNSEIARIVKSLTRNANRQDYKERVRNADYAIQIIKLADTVHNCSELNLNLPEKTIKRKVEDCKELYFLLAKEICTLFYEKLNNSIANFI